VSSNSTSSLQHCRWQVFPGPTALACSAANLISTSARVAIEEKGIFHIVLTGGNTPRLLHKLLLSVDTDWECWQIWFGDERCVPPNNSQRNSLMAMETWLNHVPIPRSNIHPIPSELGPQFAADAYSSLLADVPLFDLVLLGLGKDGHVASLFPNSRWQEAANLPAVLAVTDSTKPPAQRVSLSPARLAASSKVLFLVTGTGKREAVKKWRAGVMIPAHFITPVCGVDIFIDAAAYGDVLSPDYLID
jgi:6-phosphogluconolactonase